MPIADEDNQIIGALNDMEIEEHQDGGMMDCDVQGDDLLGLELKEMDANTSQPSASSHREPLKEQIKYSNKASLSRKHGTKPSASLGIPNKKFDVLRRGSPRKRSSSSHGEVGRSRCRHQSSKQLQIGSSTNDGLMGSKNSSHNHL